MDDRALVDKAQVEIQDIMADEEIAIHGNFPKAFDNFRFFALQHLDIGACRRLHGVAEAKYLRRCRRQAELFDDLGLVDFNLRIEQTIFFERSVGRDGFDIHETDFHKYSLEQPKLLVLFRESLDRLAETQKDDFKTSRLAPEALSDGL